MKALAIAGMNLRRMFRDRVNLFFVFVFPMLLILVLGATFGGAFEPRIGVLGPDGGLAGRLVDELESTEGIEVERASNEEDLIEAVERGTLQGGLVIPPGYNDSLNAGEDARVRYFARPDELGQQLTVTVRSVVSEEAIPLRAARFAEQETGNTFERALAVATIIAPEVVPIDVRVTTAGETLFPASLGRFDVGASSQLMVFIFLTSLTGSVALIESRRLGVSRRMLSTPTPLGTILAGETLGRFGIAMVQGVFIVFGSWLVFGVNWGDPLGATALLVAFAAVSAGAAMFLGAIFSNEQQASAIGLLLGLGLAALGGSMVPIEIFSDTMKTVAHITPHAWANDGFAELVRRDGSIADIGVELGVLVLFASALFALGASRLRATLTSTGSA